MIDKLKKYRILFTIYLAGIIVSLGTAYYINKNNIFSETAGKFAEISYSYNQEIFNNIRKFNNYLSIYTHLRSINSIKSIKTPNLPEDSGKTIDILNVEFGVFERYLTSYLYKNYPDAALSKEYRNFYGKLEMDYDVDVDSAPRIILVIRAENNKDFEAYKSFLITSTSKILITEIERYETDILLHMDELKRAIISIKNSTNIDDSNFSKLKNAIEYFYLDKYSLQNILTLTDNLTLSLTDIDIINEIDVRFYKKGSNSVYFVIPMIFIIFISFFVLVHRIFYDFRKK